MPTFEDTLNKSERVEVPYRKDKTMALWDSVCETDPAHTKKIKSRGGFTAIDAQYQIQLATEKWGPYGTNWGLEDLHWSYIWGEEGQPPLEVTLEARFYYPDGHGGISSFPMSCCMPYRVGNETRKKMQTDLTTKSLSKLGFNADVFLGLFDDNRYVEKATAKAAQVEVNKNEERKARIYHQTVESLLSELKDTGLGEDGVREVLNKASEDLGVKDWKKIKESKTRLALVNALKAALAGTE